MRSKVQESTGDLMKPRSRTLLERTGSTLDVSTAQTQCGGPHQAAGTLACNPELGQTSQ